jgi:hypothetical protein
MPNRDLQDRSLRGRGGVMGTNTRQRAGFDWTPSLAPTHSREPRSALPDLCPSPEPDTNGRRAVLCSSACTSRLSGTV